MKSAALKNGVLGAGVIHRFRFDEALDIVLNDFRFGMLGHCGMWSLRNTMVESGYLGSVRMAVNGWGGRRTHVRCRLLTDA